MSGALAGAGVICGHNGFLPCASIRTSKLNSVPQDGNNISKNSLIEETFTIYEQQEHHPLLGCLEIRVKQHRISLFLNNMNPRISSSLKGLPRIKRKSLGF
jgi:hypothetical protein